MNEPVQTQTFLSPIVKTIHVDLTVEKAFHLFTKKVDTWWPLSTHSVFGDEAVTCQLEDWVGGRFFETHRDGRTSVWGHVLIWEPPQRVAFSMHPGRLPETSGEVEVTFQSDGGRTRVTLIHSGWERLGERAEVERHNYVSGWDNVLGKYAAIASTPVEPR
jgi:uncharacterized protein YndB with AHSA1/START domain